MKSTRPATMESRPTRWCFLDWLRVTAIALVFLFHCGRFFDQIWWHLKDPARDLRFTVATLLVSQWGMPLFFLIAGTAAGLHSRRGEGARPFRYHVLRLLVPFAFGILVVVPPQVYYERLAAGEFRGSYLAFYPHYFEGLYFLGGNFSWFGHHLWFLLALFAISIVTRPIVLALGRTERIERLARIVDRAGPFVFFGAPVLVLQLALRRVGLVDPFVFVLFFLYGSLLAADARFVSAIQAQRWLALALAIATSAAYAALFLAGIVTLDDLSRHSWHYAALQTLAGFTTWAWPHALLAFGSRFANRPARLLGEVNEAVMPFYVLHQTVIIAVGYYVISSSLGTLAKLAVIATTSFTFTVFIYFSAIRSVAPVRVLLGMRRRRAG